MGIVFFTTMKTPLGPLALAGGAAGLKQISFFEHARTGWLEKGWQQNDGALAGACHALEKYFAGDLLRFDLQLDPGGTPFQQSVWRMLHDIFFGQTVTYSALARMIGQPTAVRAVASANARNPLPIVIPCHRVIGSDGKLRGYAGGLPLKARLLDHEKEVRAQWDAG